MSVHTRPQSNLFQTPSRLHVAPSAKIYLSYMWDCDLNEANEVSINLKNQSSERRVVSADALF